MRRRHRKSDCPVHFALEVFGDPWTLLIIRDLMFKDRRTYSDFLRAEEGIATNVLADRLTRLEQDGIIARDESPGGYRLTPKGIDLLPIMMDIIGWSAKHDPRTAADREFVRRLRADRDSFTRELRSTLQAAHVRRRPTDRAGKRTEVTP
ncbi:MAG TPA: helix-turn-helix domain-containing protein [Polyangia bacterium]|nr:helix-turn-helix domain-containing protein [Polyangia bacterium]